MMTAEKHIPVLLKEVLTYLDCSNGGTYLDGTFGAGGYTKAILNACSKNKARKNFAYQRKSRAGIAKNI